MSLRFRKRIKLLPGIHLNIGKKGLSTSIGVRGASVTMGKKTRVNVGLPGSGLSVNQVLLERPESRGREYPPNAEPRLDGHERLTSFGPIGTFFVVWLLLGGIGNFALVKLLPDGVAQGLAMSVWSILSFAIAWRTATATARRMRSQAQR